MSGVQLLHMVPTTWPIAVFNDASTFGGSASGSISAAVGFDFTNMGTITKVSDGSLSSSSGPTSFLSPAIYAGAFELSLDVTSIFLSPGGEAYIGANPITTTGVTAWVSLDTLKGFGVGVIGESISASMDGTVRVRNKFTLQQITRSFSISVGT